MGPPTNEAESTSNDIGGRLDLWSKQTLKIFGLENFSDYQLDYGPTQ